MKFLFVTLEGSLVDLANDIKKEGHDIKFFIGYNYAKNIGNGFVEKIENWKEYIDWADVIVFEDIGFGKRADKLRSQGKIVIGGSSYTDKLEDNRDFGQKELKNSGVIILPSWNFTNFNSAIDFIKEHPDRYVIKPSGKAQNEKELSFVGQENDGNDVINVLEHFKRNNWEKKIKEFLVQKYVSGVEVGIGAFFNGKDFIYPININFEHKKFFPGNLGPSTGEMGTSMFWTQWNKMFELTLLKMKNKLAESGYVGYIDINCIANGKGVYPLEWTSRFGFPLTWIFSEAIISEWGQFLLDLGKGKNIDIKVKKGFQIGVVIATPPFPFDDYTTFKKQSEGASIIFKGKNKDGVHIAEVKLVNNDWVIAGASGYPVIVTGSGITMNDAIKQTYNRVNNLTIPNMYYRTDIGERWVQDSDSLHTWGYLY